MTYVLQRATSIDGDLMPVRNEHEFEAAILRGGGVLCDRVAIVGTRAKRGDGDGLIWRGRFNLPEGRITIGETLHIRLDDNSLIALVVTDVIGQTVFFRARGKMPMLIRP